jgi:peptidyl-prolyl cis-trans isomerase D
LKVYERSIKALVGRSPTEFREEQARELIAAKVRDIVRVPVRVSEIEAREGYVDEKSTANITYIQVRQSWAAKYAVPIPASDVAAWAKEPASEGIIDAAMKERSGTHVRHVLAKFAGSTPTPSDKVAAKEKIDRAMARLKAGEPFVHVAKEMSDDSSAASGGDVGEKTDGFVEPFRVAADKLKPGEMTPEPVETQFGYHIIMKDAVKTEAQLADLRKDVTREIYAKTKAPDAAKALADRLVLALKGGKPAEDAVKDVLAPIAASYAAAHPPAPVRARPAPGNVDGGAADAGATAPPVVTDTPDTDPTRPQVVTTSAFNRGGDPIPTLSSDATTQLMKFAFSPDTKDGAVLGDALKVDDGVIAAQLKQHKTATKEEFDKDKDTYVPTLIARKQAEALSLYVKRLKTQAKTDIKVDDKYMADKVGNQDGGMAPSSGEEDDEGF